MHVLITRPERDAADLKARIEALGCQVTVAPLLEIELLPIDAAAISAASGIIATSRNGLRALAQSPALPAALTKPLFVVGPATAAAAAGLGFTTIIEGSGTAEGLVPALIQHRANFTGPLVHLAGDHLAFDLAGATKPHGVQLDTVQAYRSVAAKTLNPQTLELLAADMIDAVILMSPRSARTWSGFAATLPVEADISKITHICLSSAVAHGLAAMPGKPGRIKTEIANQPNTDQIVALVYRLAGEVKTG
ncbi:MAG: uroporphyrinogen-III synthase [Hyphomicrobium sp.]